VGYGEKGPNLLICERKKKRCHSSNSNGTLSNTYLSRVHLLGRDRKRRRRKGGILSLSSDSERGGGGKCTWKDQGDYTEWRIYSLSAADSL